MIDEILSKIPAGLERWRSVAREPGRPSAAVAYLQGALDAIRDPGARGLLWTLLATEYAALGMTADEEAALESAIAEQPDEPQPRLALVAFLNQDERRLSDARRQALAAVELSAQTGRFRRDALHHLARAARRRGDYSELEEVLGRLLELTLEPGAIDCDIETDFLQGLPSDAVNPELIAKYRARARSRS